MVLRGVVRVVVDGFAGVFVANRGGWLCSESWRTMPMFVDQTHVRDMLLSARGSNATREIMLLGKEVSIRTRRVQLLRVELAEGRTEHLALRLPGRFADRGFNGSRTTVIGSDCHVVVAGTAGRGGRDPRRML